MSEKRHLNPIDNPVEYKLSELVMVSMGYASGCWDPMPTGVFQSEKARKEGEKLVNSIMDLIRNI